MKKKYIIFLILPFLVSCNKSEDIITPNKTFLINSTHIKKLNAQNLKESTTESNISFNGKKVGDIIEGNRYRVNAYQHYHKYEILNITKHYGGYDSLFPYTSVTLIKDGGAEYAYSTRITYYTCESTTVYFENSLSYQVETDIYNGFNLTYEGIESNVEMKSKATALCSAKLSSYYSRKVQHEQVFYKNLILNKNVVSDMENGYSITIGRSGLYYEIEVNVTTYEIYLDWFQYKHKKITGKEDREKKAIICNEQDLNYSYIAKKIDDQKDLPTIYYA